MHSNFTANHQKRPELTWVYSKALNVELFDLTPASDIARMRIRIDEYINISSRDDLGSLSQISQANVGFACQMGCVCVCVYGGSNSGTCTTAEPDFTLDHQRKSGFLATEYRSVWPQTCIREWDRYIDKSSKDDWSSLLSDITWKCRVCMSDRV